ncbi:1,3-beta-glucan synthase component fks3 [Monosporozyma unispora]|nr:1,3-beta-glucan synthase component fks3 [Kazachstania unispora]
MDFPAWCHNDEVPVTKEEIIQIFDQLAQKFGFQTSSKENMIQLLVSQLDSRASRANAFDALISLHSSYIGGPQANFKKWYFAAQLDLDEELGYQHMKLRGGGYKRNLKLAKKRGESLKDQIKEWEIRQQEFIDQHRQFNKQGKPLKNEPLRYANYKWKLKMKQLTPHEMVRQLALYLLCWGEANQIRFTPECLCFIYKCASDYDIYTEQNNITVETPEFSYLNDVITPLYNFLKGQLKKQNSKGEWLDRNRDHKNIIGYDDVNQLFWYPEGIERIVLTTDERLVDFPLPKRYSQFKHIQWEKVFYKTFSESRSWIHCITNFNRFWIIHLAPFWFFTTYNTPTLYTKNYIQLLDNPPLDQVRYTIVAFGGTITCLIQIIATVFEWQCVPRRWPGHQTLIWRLLCLTICLLVNILPTVFILFVYGLTTYSHMAYVLSIIQMVFAILTTLLFAIRPLGGFFGSYLKTGEKKRKFTSSQSFTASFPKLQGRSKWFSYGLWIFVFTAKYIESYFFLTLSIKDPIRVLSILDLSRCHGDVLLGTYLCTLQAKITLFLIVSSDLGLFFLDTYLWYIICNCIFSIVVSLSLGTSIFTPWKNIYSRLPKRIEAKILVTSEVRAKLKPKWLISQAWNAIIISMYREHLLAIEHVQKLIYVQADALLADAKGLKAPIFFIAQDDSTYKSKEYFPKNSEAERRVSFFAQSLSTPIPEPIPIECMPSFTVLIPHYEEKIILTLNELVKCDFSRNRIPMLEYLKSLHSDDWTFFVTDTKIFAKKFIDKINDSNLPKDSENEVDTELSNANEPGMEAADGEIKESANSNDGLGEHKSSVDDLFFNLAGFSSAEHVYTIRTRIWASLRAQTLYRTIAGFMNYAEAIRLLYRIESSSMLELYGNNPAALQIDLDSMSNRKFRMLVAMQRYSNFKKEERESVDILLQTYPNVYISYLLEEKDTESGEIIYYSCLTNGTATCDELSGLRNPIFKIRLSGNPILGNGKSDNQNHSLIFYRGEYIQVVDANQDNYLEECLKIRSILSEFEELNISKEMPYVPEVDCEEIEAPVAIIGAREYIFSENIGVLGDIAAGKEQTFGTLFARTLAEIGGKLHYGHPDFLNAIFMTTRGGISKAQRGLHLNEDIYAGIMALCRGGRIKHSDYYQCGKGRDLGFDSILNFTTKIGAGMGEQLLSREYYYLGTQLPVDRFLTFFYAHPGFHLNNLFISISLHMFFILLLNLGSLNLETISCQIGKHDRITDLQTPIGCYNLEPALHWVSIFVLSIFIVFFIAFAPLIIQELLEKGLLKAVIRFLHHIISMAPLFEVFVCQTYSNSLQNDLTFGGAKYISSGRGFAITRIDFTVLYSRYATISIYSGFHIFLMLLFGTVTMWQPALLWFWITVVSLCFAPFIFNPHQYILSEFFIDYKNTLHWFSNSNSYYKTHSWAAFTKQGRARYTGYKKRRINDESEKAIRLNQYPRFWNVFLAEIFVPVALFFFNFTAYTFTNAQTGVKKTKPTNSVVRLVLVTFVPIAVNMGTLFVLFFISFVSGPIFLCCHLNLGSTIAFIAHGVSVLVYLIDFVIMWFLEGWNFKRTLILLITSIHLHIILFRILTQFLSKEFKNSKVNIAWWSGKWSNTDIGWSIVGQPIREYFVKIMEMSYFTADFLLIHILLYLQTPLLFFPFIDFWHSMMLFWLKPKSIKKDTRIFSKKQAKLRKRTVTKYTILYFLLLIILLFILIVPIIVDKYFINQQQIAKSIPMWNVIQPNKQNNNDTGPNAPTTILTTTPSLVPFMTVK